MCSTVEIETVYSKFLLALGVIVILGISSSTQTEYTMFEVAINGWTLYRSSLAVEFGVRFGSCLCLPKSRTFFGELWQMWFPLLTTLLVIKLRYTICNESPETTYHVLVDCSFAKQCWMVSLVGFAGSFVSFGAWLDALFTRCSVDDSCLAAMVCWGLWQNRNNKV